jgi:hypothetical protein
MRQRPGSCRRRSLQHRPIFRLRYGAASRDALVLNFFCLTTSRSQLTAQSAVVEQRARDESAAAQAQVAREQAAREADRAAQEAQARRAQEENQAAEARVLQEREAQRVRDEQTEKVRVAAMEKRDAETLDERRVKSMTDVKQSQYELGDLPQSKIVSDLAYAAGTAKKGQDPREMVEQRRLAMKSEFEEAVKRIDAERVQIAGNRQRVLLQNNIAYLEKIRVTDANADAIAIKDADGKTVFGFRGTAKLRDLIPDFQLAVNSKKVGRVEEAKKFVADVVAREKLQNQDLKFVGHSLGGFIAEGVRNGYVGSRATTFSSGAPLAAFIGKDKKVRAWGDYQKEKEDAFDSKNNVDTARITRVIRNGDAVSGSLNAGRAANGRANTYQMDRTKDGQLNLIANHLLRSDSAAKSVYFRREGVLLGDYRGKDAADLNRGSEQRMKDSSLLTRVRNVVSDKAMSAYRRARYYVRPGTVLSDGQRTLDMSVDRVAKAKQGLRAAVQNVRERAGHLLSAVRPRRAAPAASAAAAAPAAAPAATPLSALARARARVSGLVRRY